MRVIHCFRAPVGGLFRHVCDLVEQQFEQGLKVGIVCDSLSGGEHAAGELTRLAPNCTLGIHRLPMRRTFGLADALALRDMSRIIQRYKPDLIHGHGAKGGAYGRLLAKMRRTKTIYTPHGGSLHYTVGSTTGLFYLTLERILKRLTDGLILVSRYSAETYQRKIGDIRCPYRVIHNGLGENEFKSLAASGGGRTFVFVGELRLLKGVDVLLQALSMVETQRKISLLIFGAGPDADLFKQRTKQLGLSQRVTFLPPIFPARKAFANAACVVVPSLAESFPYIVLEALASNVPVVATQVGGIPEIFGPFADRLIPPNEPASLARAMQQVLIDPKDTQRLAENLRAHVHSNFKITKMAEKTLKFYQDVMSDEEHQG